MPLVLHERILTLVTGDKGNAMVEIDDAQWSNDGAQPNCFEGDQLPHEPRVSEAPSSASRKSTPKASFTALAESSDSGEEWDSVAVRANGSSGESDVTDGRETTEVDELEGDTDAPDERPVEDRDERGADPMKEPKAMLSTRIRGFDLTQRSLGFVKSKLTMLNDEVINCYIE